MYPQRQGNKHKKTYESLGCALLVSAFFSV
ncbi:hypothetical protein FLJU110815_18945 [Flavobacterium jumunjinense]